MRGPDHLVVVPKRLLRDAGGLEVKTKDAHALLLLFGQELLQVFWLKAVDPVQSRAAQKKKKKKSAIFN